MLAKKHLIPRSCSAHLIWQCMVIGVTCLQCSDPNFVSNSGLVRLLKKPARKTLFTLSQIPPDSSKFLQIPPSEQGLKDESAHFGIHTIFQYLSSIL